MLEHIVIILRSGQSVSEASQHVKALPSWATLEPQFPGLPPVQANEQSVMSEMRRTMRFVCPSGVDIDELVRRLQTDPTVEYAYREPPAAPAGTFSALISRA